MLTEQGASWIPSTLKQLDGFHKEMTATGRIGELRFDIGNMLPRLPSEYFATNCWVGASFPSPTEVGVLDSIALDRFMWGSDYPHKEGTYPYTREACVGRSRRCPKPTCARSSPATSPRSTTSTSRSSRAGGERRPDTIGDRGAARSDPGRLGEPGDARTGDLRALVEALVEPFSTELDTASGREYLQIVSQLSMLFDLWDVDLAGRSDRDQRMFRVDGRVPAAPRTARCATSASPRCSGWSPRHWRCGRGCSTPRVAAAGARPRRVRRQPRRHGRRRAVGADHHPRHLTRGSAVPDARRTSPLTACSSGKTVLVTAAAGTGIGSAVAQRCVEEGARVVDLRQARATPGRDGRARSACPASRATSPTRSRCRRCSRRRPPSSAPSTCW